MDLSIDRRTELRLKLLLEGNGKVPLCPFCQYRAPGGITHPASQMHEIIIPRMKGGKWTPNFDDPNPDVRAKVRAVYVLENLVLACWACNGERWIDRQDKGWVLGIKIQQPGYSVERVIPKIIDIARVLKYPVGVVPTTVEIPGCIVTLDLKSYTYTIEAERSQDV